RSALLFLLFQLYIVQAHGQTAVNPSTSFTGCLNEPCRLRCSTIGTGSQPHNVVAHRTPEPARYWLEIKRKHSAPFPYCHAVAGLSNGLLFGLLVLMFAILTLSVAANKCRWQGLARFSE
ncbi:MAG: hypothetical protein IPL27_19850, partial [Lewinellaceae bacterium]|nr:hypothetical protein [Lewinellaceae bacterium]